MQSKDTVFYNNEKYILFACEENKNLINSAVFEVEGYPICLTSCYRGYYADYYIENDFIYGIKKLEKNYTESGYNSSPKTKLNYTGSIIIARDRELKFCRSFLYYHYTNYDMALEMYFIDGELAEVNDLAPAIKEWNKLCEDAEAQKQKPLSGQKQCKYKKQNIPILSKELYYKQEEIAKKYLKYKYNEFCDY